MKEKIKLFLKVLLLNSVIIGLWLIAGILASLV